MGKNCWKNHKKGGKWGTLHQLLGLLMDRAVSTQPDNWQKSWIWKVMPWFAVKQIRLLSSEQPSYCTIIASCYFVKYSHLGFLKGILNNPTHKSIFYITVNKINWGVIVFRGVFVHIMISNDTNYQKNFGVKFCPFWWQQISCHQQMERMFCVYCLPQAGDIHIQHNCIVSNLLKIWS